MSLALSVSGLSKQYSIQKSRFTVSYSPDDSGKVKENSIRESMQSNSIWALQDVSFSVRPGEVVGIIGRNGAGKSTLFKILSRVTEPTTGRAEVIGKMASLLEVGTGFHPELTGRENVYLNGAFLGMKRAVINERFSDIVDYAEVSKFIDTPVKYYSSGMYVRLAFSVAAFLDADILLLDEVLAVGDLAFQKKCLGSMRSVAEAGRTVLMVSHNIGAINQFCTKALLIEEGRLTNEGPTPSVIHAYHESLRKQSIHSDTGLRERLNGLSGAVRFTGFRIQDSRGEEKYEFFPGETIQVRFSYKAFQSVSSLSFCFYLRSDTTDEVLTSFKCPLTKEPMKKGTEGAAILELPNNSLLPRQFLPYLWLGDENGGAFDRIDYSQTGCPMILIRPRSQTDQTTPGYFSSPFRLIHL